MKHLTLLTLLTLLSLAPLLPCSAQAPATAPTPPASTPPAPAKLQLQDGDRFIFIGDSITHQCLYTQYVENFYFTRYPDRRIHFRNAGVSGDRAADVLARFDDDIARFKPTVATVLLGMNDGSYKDFDAETFATYQRDMTTLLDKLDALGCRIFLMGPTMFDHQAWDKRIIEKPEYAKGRIVTGYNAVLGYYSGWLRETARQRGYGYIDLWSTLNRLTEEGRQTDPHFTLIEDAIHPDAPGQLAMAHTLLSSLQETRTVSQINAQPIKNQWRINSKTATLGQPTGTPGETLAFDLLPSALPWVVGEEAAAGFKMTRAGHTLSQEAYALSGFKPGTYELLMNGQSVGQWPHTTLARRIEIQEDPDSLTLQQANKVAALNKQRNDDAIRPLRNLYSQRKGRLRAAQTPEKQAEFNTWLTDFQKQQTELEAKAKAFEDQIYQANQPQTLRIEIKPTAAAARPATSTPAKK
jgi:lysophospholipase L1-like esterase